MDMIIDFLNTVFWGYILIYGLLIVGVFFTLKLKFLQFIHFKEMFKSVSNKGADDSSGITPFQALMISLASRVGTGNLAGVAVALYLGGPGAIFWMWMVALVGMATAYSESTLAQLYKIKDENNAYRGGPAFYISKGLNSPLFASIFAISLIIAFGLVFNAVQANSITGAVSTAFDLDKSYIAIVIAALTALVIFGGIKSVAKIAQIIVPLMAGIYLLVALYVVMVNITVVPEILMTIIKSAFGLQEAAGGVTGGVMAAMMNGIKRGLFSNEAGMGSAPNIAAVAVPAPHHPSSQGFVQALGVFIDTILICTATAIMILLSGIMDHGSGVTGIELTQAALSVHIGDAGVYFIAIAIFFFAFTSIIGNYTYAENAFTYLGIGNKLGLLILRISVIGMVLWGSFKSVATVFNAADAAMGLMASINLVAIVLLSGTVVKLTKDFLEQRKEGKEPTFNSTKFPEIKGVDDSIWGNK